ncbi:PHP domain-containing protein, partial [Corynebacterium tuscaniense]
MRFNGGKALSWAQLERILSGRPGPAVVPVDRLEQFERGSRSTPAGRRRSGAIPFAELHAASTYSFLSDTGGASEPEELVARAHELGLSALGLLDRDGFYGAVKFAEAAAEVDLPTVFGAELSLPHAPLPVIARGAEGYRRLSHLMAGAHMASGEKGVVHYPPLPEMAAALAGTCIVLAGWRWVDHLDELVECFGVANVVKEYEATMLPEDADRHTILRAVGPPGLREILTAAPGAATRDGARVAGAKRALGRRKAISAASADLHPMGAPWLRSGEQLAAMMPDDTAMIAEAV